MSYQRSQELDPAFAPSYVGTASVCFMLAILGDEPATEAFAKAKAAATMALGLDETLAEAHATMGLSKLNYDWDWAGAEQEMKRALTLNPSSSWAHSSYGLFLTAMNRSEDAIIISRYRSASSIFGRKVASGFRRNASWNQIFASSPKP